MKEQKKENMEEGCPNTFFLKKDKSLQGRGAEPHSAKKEKEYAPKRFDQTFFKGLRHGANPCRGETLIKIFRR